jgi:hypothetical protein
MSGVDEHVLLHRDDRRWNQQNGGLAIERPQIANRHHGSGSRRIAPIRRERRGSDRRYLESVRPRCRASHERRCAQAPDIRVDQEFECGEGQGCARICNGDAFRVPAPTVELRSDSRERRGAIGRMPGWADTPRSWHQEMTPYSRRPSSSMTAVNPSAVSRSVIGMSPERPRHASRSHARPFSLPSSSCALANARATRTLRSVSSGLRSSPFSKRRCIVLAGRPRFSDNSLIERCRQAAALSSALEGMPSLMSCVHLVRSSGASKRFLIWELSFFLSASLRQTPPVRLLILPDLRRTTPDFSGTTGTRHKMSGPPRISIVFSSSALVMWQF